LNERKAPSQNDDGRRDDPAASLTDPGHHRSQLGWEQHSNKAAEDGDPAKYRHSTGEVPAQIL